MPISQCIQTLLHRNNTFLGDNAFEGTVQVDGVATIVGNADGGLTNYDLKVGDTDTPDYGMIQFGNAVMGRTSYNVGDVDLDGAVIFRNLGGPVTGKCEFLFEEGSGATRFALPSSGVGNATYNARSMLLAGPAPADSDMVTVGYWQTNEDLFHNLACDTAGDGADLGVQNDLEVEGDLFVDSIKESTTSAGIAFRSIIVLPKASGNGIQVDTASATFGWRDLRAEIRTRGVGASDPNDTTYIGNVKAYTFSVGDEAWIEFHIPHDYVKGTDIHLHFHWSHNSANVTGGSITLGADVTYAKGHDQAAFAATINPTLSPNASTTQYRHLVSEVQLSAGSPSATQIDTDDLEPDGLILARVYLAANNITSNNGVPDPFIHEVDVHYQSTNMATKNNAPDFYA